MPHKNLHLGTNIVTTTRYNWYNLIPLYLWDVFNPKQKLANVFFLVVSILQCIPSISLTNGLPSSLPSLLTIIGAEAVHMGIIEAKRRKSDKECNSRRATIWSTEDSCWVDKQWKDVLVLSVILFQIRQEISSRCARMRMFLVISFFFQQMTKRTKTLASSLRPTSMVRLTSRIVLHCMSHLNSRSLPFLKTLL